jgi:hypothetical protein
VCHFGAIRLYAQEPIDNCKCSLKIGSGVGKRYLSSLSLPPLGGQCVTVIGEFILDAPPGNTFDGAEVRMAPGALFVIGVNTTITGANFHGCDKMWNSIAIATLPSPIFSPPIVNFSSCSISDASIAVNVSNNSTFTCTNTIFSNNRTGIRVNSAPVVDLLVENCTFSNFSPLLPAYPGQVPTPTTESEIGIHFNNVNGSKIDVRKNFYYQIGIAILAESSEALFLASQQIMGYPFFHDKFIGMKLNDCEDVFITTNSFSNLQNCIVVNSHDKSLEISNNAPMSSWRDCISITDYHVAQNGQPAFNYSMANGGKVTENHEMYTLFGNGISVKNTIGGGVFAISRNIMNIGGYSAPISGIEVSNSNSPFTKFVIGNNTIVSNSPGKGANGILNVNSISPTNIGLNHISTYAGTPGYLGNGIIVANVQNTILVDNDVTGQIVGKGKYTIQEGIRVDAGKTILCCNKPDFTNYGVCYFGQNQTHFANTAFKHHDIRLYLGGANIGQQNNTGNDWSFSDPDKSLDAQFDGNPNSIASSKFFTQSTNIPDGYSKIEVVGGTIADAMNWFTFNGTDPDCQYSVASNQFCGMQANFEASEPEAIDESDLGVANLPIDDSDALNTLAQTQLYSKLKRNPNLISNSNALSQFSNLASTSQLETLSNLNMTLSAIGDYPPALEAQLEAKEYEMQILTHEMHALRAQMEQYTIGSADLDALIIESNQKQTLIAQCDSEIQSIKTQLRMLDQERIDQLMLLNQQLSESTPHLQYLKAINAVYFAHLNTQVWEFDEVEKNLIDQISGICPMDGGQAVYIARSMKSFYSPVDWTGDRDCLSTEERAVVAPTLHSHIALYPNPAASLISIPTLEELQEGDSFRIIDAFGKTVATSFGTPKSTQIDISQFGVGIYFIVISTAHETEYASFVVER